MAVLPAAYGGYKDVNEAWVAGTLVVGTWPATATDGHPATEMPEELRGSWEERADRAAWVGLTTPLGAGR